MTLRAFAKNKKRTGDPDTNSKEYTSSILEWNLALKYVSNG